MEYCGNCGMTFEMHKLIDNSCPVGDGKYIPDKVKLLCEFSEWLNKNGYVDDDMWNEEISIDLVGEFLKSRNT